jgi:subtilase family serine protease/flagellar hook assembly protein FlgD
VRTRIGILPGVLLCGAFVSAGADREIRFLEDRAHIAVLEHDGSPYDKTEADGTLNTAPRERIARELIATHGDFYDFLVVFTNFEFDRGGAVATYTTVRNDVSGIGVPTFDNGDAFGSPKRLQGFIDMGPLSQYRSAPFSLDPRDPDFRTTLGVLAHEIGHRWLASPRFLADGVLRDDLLGRSGDHWSFLLSSQASFLYGNDWESLSGGRYWSKSVQSRFSDLDLYLMGFLAPEEVSPLTLLSNPEVDRTRLPELSVELEAVAETVTIEQIIAAEGARLPSHRGSQKDFTIAFVFLTAPDLVPTESDLGGVELVRSNFMDAFFSLSRGRALADPDLHHATTPTAGAEPDAFRALSFLLGRQQADGRFEAHPLTAVRDTASAVLALETMGVRGDSIDRARAYLSLQNSSSVDSFARALAAGAALDGSRLLALRNPDGGYGIGAGYRSDPLDTALVLQALPSGPEPLAAMQLPDGSWSSIDGEPGDVMTTSEAALALERAGGLPGPIQAALGWLVSRQQPDGGFGDGPSTPYATALALEALLKGAAPPTSVERAIAYLRETQGPDGSWGGSVFDTSAVLRALVPSTFPNLSIETADIRLEPDPPEVSEIVRVEVTVRNRSRVASTGFDVQLFDGDPEEGGVAIGAPVAVAALLGGGSETVSFSWDTDGVEGRHTLLALADFAGAVTEVSKEDNFALREVDVLPPLPNLVSQLSVLPARPIAGSEATLTARVENRGTLASTDTTVRFYRETPRLGNVLGEAVVPPLAAGESRDVSAIWDGAGPLGAHRIWAVVDPEDDVRERLETDNETSTAVDVRPPPPAEPDLEIESFALSPSELHELPQIVSFAARVGNTGLDPVPSARAELFLGSPAEGGVLLRSESFSIAGDSVADVAFDLEVATGGTRTYFLRIDAGATLERDLSNNLASAVLRDRMDTIDVALVPGSVALSEAILAPGEILDVDVALRNTGTRPLGSIAVGLFYETGGGFRSAYVVNLPLSPGETSVVRLSWKANITGVVPLELRADPDNALSESNEGDNVLPVAVEVTPSTLPNLTLSSAEVAATPEPLLEGQTARLEARVRNLGDGPAGSFSVRFFAANTAIGSAAVSGLGPREERLVAVDWNPVHGRGDTPVEVAIDADREVEEIDEEDNEVFRVFDIVGLPDLLATSAQLVLTPAFPRSGEAVSIEASFQNAGEQAASLLRAELRLDDPLSGDLLSSVEIEALPPGAGATFGGSWDTAGIEGEHAVFLVLDAGDDVLESREDNNAVRVPVALQDSDVFVTPVYFSPNGDGVQDEAALFFRLPEASEVRVQVRDAEGGLVRELSALGGNGSAVWDGRTATGVLAPDSEYAFVLLADGADAARRRVVLDTNRSRIVEALGTDLLSLTPLTCSFPDFIEGPAWLPDDAAAFVIVREADLANAPEFPVGLYRVSADGAVVEPIREDVAFAETTFVSGLTDFSTQRLRAVSPDGERALVRSFSAGIQVLDLSTGALTPLGHEYLATASWTANGRVLVASSTGVFLYAGEGSLERTLVPSGAEVALASPDGLRVVYRRLDEAALRIVNADGSGERLLESTSAAPFFDFELDPGELVVDTLYFLGDEGAFVFSWFANSQEQGSGSLLIDPEEDVLDFDFSEFAGELSSDQRFEISGEGDFYAAKRFRGRETRPALSGNVGSDLHWSYRDVHLTYRAFQEEGCIARSLWVIRSLLNGEATFRLTRLPSRFGVKIAGTASDRNLESHRLEFAPVSAPQTFSPIEPPSSTPVVDDTFTTWIPPAPGDYFVRLTVQDRAGNVTRRLDRIFWDETPPISSLRRAPAYVSAAGGEMVVSYDVLTPANLVFRIRDAEGNVVRTFRRDEPAPGPASFAWDGTNEVGIPVEDGRYVLEIEDAELPVFVDRTSPLASVRFGSLYTDGEEARNERLAVDLEGTVRDENLDRWELAAPEGEAIASAQREVLDSLLLESLHPAQGLELRAFDYAGNRTVVPLAGPSREVRVLRASGDTVGPTSPGPAEAVPAQFIRPRSTVSFRARASFAGDLVFRYRPEGEASFEEVPTSGDLTLRAEDLVLGRRYTGQFESDGLSSQEVAFTVGPEAIFLSLSTFPQGSLQVRLFVTNTIAEPLVEARLLRSSGASTDVVKLYRPMPARDEILEPVPACGAFVSYRVEAMGASGVVYRSTTEAAYPSPASTSVRGRECLSVDDAGIEDQDRPEDPAPGEAVAFIRNDFFSEPVELALLLDGVEVGRATGALGDRALPFDVSAAAEGEHALRVKAHLPAGESVDGDFGLSFFLDQSPPETAIVSPPEGGNACVVSQEGRDFVELDVLARDRKIEDLWVELRNSDGSFVRLTSLDAISFPATEVNRPIRVAIPPGLEGNAAMRLVARGARLVTEAAGLLAPPGRPLWPKSDNNGSLLGSATRNLVLSRPLPLGPLSAEPALFSPNGDGFADGSLVRGEAGEAVTLTARVFRLPARERVRTLASSTSQSAGPFEIVWDGKDDLGLAVSDGKYVVQVDTVNGCGGASTSEAEVEVDATPPLVDIESLTDFQAISIGIEVFGTATDPHFDHYVLEYGEGPAPSSFVEIGPPVPRRVEGKLLGSWPVDELAPGPYTLRLTAADAAFNRGSARVVVDVQRADFIAAHGVDPVVFREATEVRFDLKADARVTLQIRRADETVVATLLDRVVAPAGPQVAIWDGQGVQDSEYVAYLLAENPAAPSLFEESRATVILDRTAPLLDIASPQSSDFVSIPGTILGAISDLNLERYKIEVGPLSGPLNEIAGDTLPAAGVLAALRGLPDSDYRLRAEAIDRAGNRALVELTFHVDSTKPKLALTSPVPGSFLSRPPETVPVRGSVEETNLDRYDLELGFGDPPAVFVPLAGGTSDSIAANWDLDGLPDGPYTLRLTAADQAGNFAQVATEVTLDATPPSVVLESASQGQVRGSLTDANFEEGSLLVAPAERPAQLTEIAELSTPVASGVLMDGLALEDGEYVLELRARDRAGNQSTATLSFSVDTDPPLPPSGLSARALGRDVTLEWTGSPSADVSGYHVSRGGVRLTMTPTPGTSFLDPGLSEGRYSYTVVAVDGAGLESEPLGPAAAAVDLTPPLAILRAPDDFDRVRVSVDVLGTAFSESDFLEYRLSVASAARPESPSLLARSPVPLSFATLAQWLPTEDADYILTLEAEDTSGNVAKDSVRVTVDNVAPPAPVLLRAEIAADPEDVELEWQGSAEPDIEGFLVFRNGRNANAAGAVPGPSYLDAVLPDGRHCYRVAAVDEAGNTSVASNELCVVLDNRAPKAILVDPLEGARFDAPRRLLAETEDLDVGTVAFEFQRTDQVVWTLIAAASAPPFEALWDIGGLALGDYRLRAVATDAGTRSDPAPAFITVTLGDATPPEAPAALEAHSSGASALLSWEAVAASDLQGYRVYRDSVLALETSAPTATDPNLADGEYEYEVSSFDLDGNESARSESASVRVYAPRLRPLFPVYDTEAVDVPGENADAGSTVRLLASGGSTTLSQATADSEGAFTFSSVGLPLGVNLLDAEATDAAGNVSRRSAEVLLVRNERPATPSGFNAAANGDRAELSWDANGEADLSGYLVTRDGEILNPRGLLGPGGPVPAVVTAAASKNPGAAGNVLDGSPSYWNIGPSEEQWIELRLATPRHIEEIRLLWAAQWAASDYDLSIEIEGRLAPVARVRGNSQLTASIHALPIPVSTARVRLQIFSGVNSFGILLQEFQLFGILPEAATAFGDEPSQQGFYEYAVEALDVLGGRSDAAGPVRLAVGDVTPPAAPLNLAATPSGVDVLLSWSASAEPDVERYRVFRDGVAIGESVLPSYVDRGLRNGSYVYHVAALDEAGNESAPSNDASAAIDVSPPSAPVLAVSAVPAGRVLSLSWTESTGPLAVLEYAVLRASSSGGPYSEIARVPAAAFLDRGLENGVEVFYVVRAVDIRGEPSLDSNEASATPEDSEPPEAPVFVAPTLAGAPRTVSSSRVDAVGAAEPGSRVSVIRDGASLGSVEASSGFTDLAAPFLGSSFNVSGRFALSPDRTLAAEVLSDEVLLYSLATGEVRTAPFTGALSFARGAAISPSGRKLAVATTAGFDVNRSLRVLDLESGTTEVFETAGAPQSPAWISEEEVAVAIDLDIRVLDAATGAERTLYTALSGFPPVGLTASADGELLAWSERGEEVFVLSSAGGAPSLAADDFRLDRFVWAGRRTLAFTIFDEGLYLYDADSGAAAVVAGSEGMTRPASLGPEGAVSAFRGETLFWILPGGRVMELGEKPSGLDLEFLGWSSGLSLAGTASDLSLRILEPPGRFELGVRLSPGPNLLLARAKDDRGNDSADSEGIEISFDDSSLPDLTVSGTLGIVPALPVSGDVASVFVPIRNAGAIASEASVVSLTGADEDGNLYAVGTRALPALAPGASTTLSFSWETSGRLGPQQLSASIDPLLLLDETNEDNNAASASATVVGVEALELALSLGRGTYGAGETVAIEVSALNGGAGRTVVLETTIEDGDGALVALVDSRSASLPYAESLRYFVSWNTGATFAGNYVARVRTLGASAAAQFNMQRTLAVTLDVTSEKPAYLEGDAVGLLSRIENAGGNSPLTSLVLRFRVFDPEAQLLFETTEAHGYLPLGSSAALRTVWPSGALDPGIYRATVEALDEGALVAAAEKSFEMRDLATASLEGRLSLAPAAVLSGEDLVLEWEIANESVASLANGTVRVEVLGAGVSAEGALSVGARSEARGELRLSTAGLSLGRYTLVLSAGGSLLEPLASASAVVFAIPSAPSLNAPAMGAKAPQRLLLSVNNASNPNNESLKYDFEIYLDAGLSFRLGAASGLPEGTNATAWSVPLALEENRSYFWRARAFDRFATSEWMSPAEVLVDSGNDRPDPPILSEPADSSEVSSQRPTLVVENALDPDGDVLTYAFELYRDPGLSDLVEAVSGSASTAFAPALDLEEDGTYFWRARASDLELDSDWMPQASFRVNTSNQAPAPPAPLSPRSTKVSTLSPELVASAGRDPESDPVTHTVQIDASDRFDSTVLQVSPPLSAAGGEVRWIPPAPLEENGLYFWRARASDGFAVSSWSETVSFRVDVSNEPPSAPTPERPTGGGVVESTTPTLVVAVASDAEGDPLTYGFEVYEDEALTTLVSRVDGLRDTAWVVSPRLEDQTTYFWVAFAHDGRVAGTSSRTESFRVRVMNEEPGAPTLVAPASGATVSTPAPTLVVANAADPDLDPLTYEFEVYGDEALTMLVEASGGVPEGAGETTFVMTAALEENRVYFWRTRAHDGSSFGSWMVTARFRFSLENEPPGSPVPIEPLDGAILDVATPVLVVENAADPENDALVYTFEVFRDGVLVAESPPVAPIAEASGRTSWAVEVPLEENGTYDWRAAASDGALSGSPSALFRFTVDALEEPPTPPILLSPADGAVVPSTAPLLVVENAASPDGPRAGTLVYHFALYDDPTATRLVAEDLAVREGIGTTTWAIPVTLTPGTPYFWRARAFDSRGLASDWPPAFGFVTAPTNQCAPEWSETFERRPLGTAPILWQLEGAFLDPDFEVEDVSGGRRLTSEDSGIGSLLFAGNGEAFDWRNYEFSGELRFEDGGDCVVRAGVVFYARPQDAASYGLLLTSPECAYPEARVVRVSGIHVSTLGTIDLAPEDGGEPIRFEIETLNDLYNTRIRVRLEIADDEYLLEVEDAEAPLRSGTVGAFSGFAEASWNDLRVVEVPGFASGISGDADGNGVCDSEDVPEVHEVCLDEGYDPATGLSASVIARFGSTRHDGPTACGAGNSYSVRGRTGILVARSPELAGGTYQLRLLVRRSADRKIDVVLPDGSAVLVRSDDYDDDSPFVWSEPIDAALASGAHELRIRSKASSTVYVERLRLEREP